MVKHCKKPFGAPDISQLYSSGTQKYGSSAQPSYIKILPVRSKAKLITQEVLCYKWSPPEYQPELKLLDIGIPSISMLSTSLNLSCP